MNKPSENEFSYSEDDELIAQFVEWTTDALVELREILDTLEDTAPTTDEKVMRVYDLTHNIKGMGSSFQFDLLTNVGSSLCSYLKKMPEGQLASKRVIESHIRTVEVVLAHKITGSGGDKGAAILKRLDVIIHEEA